jgi:hypothetical protein
VPSLDFCIARHKEDITWTADLPGRVFVYNSVGWPFLFPRHVKVTADLRMPPAKNGGGEAGAYLRHILEHWDDLADTTVFTQGEWADHCVRLSGQMKSIWRGFLTRPAERWTPLGDTSKIRTDASLSQGPYTHHGKVLPRSPLVSWTTGFAVRDFCVYLFGKDYPDEYEITYGSIFAVPRRLITLRPKDFWQRAEDAVSHAPVTLETAILEHLWPVLFVEGFPPC